MTLLSILIKYFYEIILYKYYQITQPLTPTNENHHQRTNEISLLNE